MSLIIYKVELKLKLIKSCALAAAGADNADANSNNFIFIIKDTKFYVTSITLSAKGYQNLWKILCKRFERSLYWNEYQTNRKNKNTLQKYRYFFGWNFVGVNRLFVMVYSNQNKNSKRFKIRSYYLPKDIIKNYNLIINGKNFYEERFDSDIKRYKEMRKFTTGQDEGVC